MKIIFAAVAGLVLLIPGAGVYYESGHGIHCTSCHEMQSFYDSSRQSTHRREACEKCHGGTLQLNNLSRAWVHIRGDLPEQFNVGHAFAVAMNDQCRSCHQQEFATWQSGGHSATYQRIFFEKSKSNKILMDDCLRCHGMFFEGGIREVMARPDLAQTTSMPCITCHDIHREGQPMQKGAPREIARPSLAFFDRRTQRHIPLAELSIPVVLEGARVVKMSPDQRQALCYQCHAPRANRQVASGDDRTGLGVHEGISCLACHDQHGQKTRASCASCHPKMSNCGLDVEKMDTTFASTTSKHNIHWVKCADCHTKGVPRRGISISLSASHQPTQEKNP